jgi:hypothetical protein
MRIKRLLQVITLSSMSLIMVGCADMAQIKREEGKTQKDYTIPTRHNELIPMIIKSSLKDPYSAKIELYSGPKFTSFRPGFFADYSGYGVCYTVNAKNSYGAYAGSRMYLFIMDGDKIVLTEVQDNTNPIGASQIINKCKSLMN